MARSHVTFNQSKYAFLWFFCWKLVGNCFFFKEWKLDTFLVLYRVWCKVKTFIKSSGGLKRIVFSIVSNLNFKHIFIDTTALPDLLQVWNFKSCSTHGILVISSYTSDHLLICLLNVVAKLLNIFSKECHHNDH